MYNLFQKFIDDTRDHIPLHQLPEPGGCPAFPNGFPESILNGENPHTSPVEGQHWDFVFTPVNPKIKDLHDKFFYSFQYPVKFKISAKERKELFKYIEGRELNEYTIGEMLLASHPEYGKLDKHGFIKII